MRCFLLMVFLIRCAPASAQSVSSPSVPTRGLDSSLEASASTDYLIVAGEWDHVVSTQGGGTGSIDWLRATPSGSTYAAGAAVSSITDSRWGIGKGEIALRPREGLILHAQARIGGGYTSGARFSYRAYDAGLAYRTSTRLYVTFDDQYLHVGETRGHLLKPGLAFSPARRVTTELTYAHSAGGTLDAEHVAGRLAVTMRQATLVSGAAAGRTAPEVFDVGVGGAVMTRDLREGFLGVQIRLPGAELMLIWSDLDVDAIHKRTLAASLKYQLRTR
jgi:hypothetical protein